MARGYDLIALDLDDTLLGPDHRISRRNAEAVARVRAAGVEVCIASGRMHETTLPFQRELSLTAPIVSYNGALVKDETTGERLHHLPLPAGPAREVVAFCAEHGFHLSYYLNDHLYVERPTRWSDLYARRTGARIEPVGALAQFEGERPTKLILIDTPETADRLYAQWSARFGEAVYVTRTSPEYLEFMHPRADKAAGLAAVAGRLGVPRERVAAFGDSMNDVPMLRWAGLGVAMGNAREAVREAADRVCGHSAEDGLAEALDALFPT